MKFMTSLLAVSSLLLFAQTAASEDLPTFNLNTAKPSEIQEVLKLNMPLAREIVIHRAEFGRITSLKDFKKDETFSDQQIERIRQSPELTCSIKFECTFPLPTPRPITPKK